MVISPTGLDLERFPELEPSALVRTFSAFGPLLTIIGYDRLSERLTKSFKDVVLHTYRSGEAVPEDVDVLLFPYDFRRSVADAAERLAGAVRATLGPEASSRRRVIVVAHSMGGLVARYWIGPLGGWSLCSALLTLGTPHRGAPKAVDWLVRGPGIGPLRHPGLRKVLRRWPSLYELLPQYPAVWDENAGRETELTRLQPSAYAAQFATMAAAGRQVHDDIATAWGDIPAGRAPDVIPYFGRGHATPNLITLRPSGRLTVVKEDPAWRGNVGWAGDGTVPALSAIPRELGEQRAVWRGMRERHGPLTGTPSVIEVLRTYSGEPMPTRGGEAPETPWLGLDVEDVVPAGIEVAVGVTIQPEAALAAGVQITLCAVPVTAPPVFTTVMTGSERTWRATLPALLPGRYRIEFEARQVRGPESIFADVDLVVLDPTREAEAAEEVL
ncbi:Lecithin:cholesterol acyltransferase [Amycolatopsis pretoriensis]|uniref:Lecithin:cholesterol acyltransferase n=1 Tax=Amycolatopsis pretoriensis TaxID=218821 RepID=A0A1H5R6S5_9PSEU|nr:hypothetical protein [Amycolatopsis pretoriensis]SEF34102.1 Lecithin:cholesterol acyltransferase [Amycolatopsis pretoriensis]